MTRAAEPSSWKSQAMPAAHATIALDRAFSAAEMEQIRLGVIPGQMEDKWFVYWLDDTLYFHRSWTGNCVFRVRFVAEGDGCRMVGADLNRDPEQVGSTNDARDGEMISYLIDVLLLGVSAEYPSEEPDPAKRTIANWGVAGRAMLGKRPGRE